jgi:hypothetical protein
MAPWSIFSGPGSDAEALPSSIEPAVRGVDTAFEVFIDGALTKVYNEASGRSKEQRALRASCKTVLGALIVGGMCDGKSLQEGLARFRTVLVTDLASFGSVDQR